MSTKAQHRLLFDADVLIKLSAFDCFMDAIAALELKLADCATLKSMTFSAGIANIKVRERKAGCGPAAQRLLKTLRTVAALDDMSVCERELAVKIGQASQRLNLAVDGGEAMLMSVCIHRGLPYVTTGDKKAIRSLPYVAAEIVELSELQGKLMPLEFVLLRLVQQQGFVHLHARLRSGMQCDTAVRRILEGCGGRAADFEAGLRAKLAVLRRDAPGFIAG